MYWISVIALDHVHRAVADGRMSADAGAERRLRALAPGDRVLFYAPRTERGTGAPVRRFAAVGTVLGEAPEPAGSAPDAPWHLAVRFDEATSVEAKPLAAQLSFVTNPTYWGVPFRRGLFRIPAADFHTIAEAMGARSVR